MKDFFTRYEELIHSKEVTKELPESQEEKLFDIKKESDEAHINNEEVEELKRQIAALTNTITELKEGAQNGSDSTDN